MVTKNIDDVYEQLEGIKARLNALEIPKKTEPKTEAPPEEEEREEDKAEKEEEEK